MKSAVWTAVLLSASFALGESNQPSNNKNNNGEVTVRGCVNIMNGDYVLTKQDPGDTYQLEKAAKMKFRNYLGQRVEITGTQSTTVPTSEDDINRQGTASPVSIRVKSIKTIDKECRSH